MAGQVEIANDLRPQKRNYVGAHRELEARKHFFGDRGAAQHMTALEHQNFLAGARQIGGGGKAVMPPANDDCLVLV